MSGSVVGGVAARVVERRREARFEGGIRSSFTSNEGGAVRVVPCLIESLSASAMRVATAETVRSGQPIWIDIEGFGPIRATVETVRHDGFICQNLLNDPARRRFGVWISWLARRGGRTDGEKRRYMRTRPRDTRTTVAFEDGEVIAVSLQDVSRSGAAVLTPHLAMTGEAVMLGRVLGRISRQFDGGFAVAFDQVLDAAEADRLVAGYQVKTSMIASVG